MPDYNQLKISESDNPELVKQKKRAAKKLKLLREQMSSIPRSELNYDLLLATWNIREFDSTTFGDRVFESNYYIAEIISKFDIVAIQEVDKSIEGLKLVMRILGDDWKYIISDKTEGTSGNDERIAYVYNSRKIQFGGLAGEMVVPPLEIMVPDPADPTKEIKQEILMNQLWRTPLISGFSVGWAKFMLCNVHVKWGTDESSRAEEIKHLAEYLERRSLERTNWARKLILLGDFNISNVNSPTLEAFKDAGYKSPDVHQDIMTTVGAQQHQYDRIFVKERDNKFEIIDGGKVELFKNLFLESEEQEYRDANLVNKLDGTPAMRFKQWRTHQLSDHEPLWVRFRIEYEAEYLDDIIAENT